MNDYKDCTIYDLEDVINTLDEILKNTKELPVLVNPIHNLDNFKDHLRLANMYDKEMEEFIDTYMRYYNG